MRKQYLITGAAGHLGNALIHLLAKTDADILALVLPNERHIPAGDVQLYRGDVCDANSLRPFFENADGQASTLIHAAGIVSITSKQQKRIYETNVSGTMNILALCKQYGIGKLVYVSSVHAIPEKPKEQVIAEVSSFDPENVIGAYAKTKAQASRLVLQAAQEGLNASIVHPSGILGPYDNGNGHLTGMVTAYCNGALPAIVKGGYDFVDVRDVAQGILSCCEKGRQGEGYILSNRYFSITELIHLLSAVTGLGENTRVLPHWFIDRAAPLAELYYKARKQSPLFTAYSLYTLRSNALFSHEKATQELGYTTRAMEDTLTDTVKWLRHIGRI